MISASAVKPVVMMVAVQIALTGVNILYKLAGSHGYSLPVLIVYRFLFAAATIAPLALIFERKNRPKLTWKILFQGFVCALFGGSLAQNLYAASLELTSATFVAAISNIVPAMTFLLAICFRMEALGIKTLAGKAKLMGTAFSIGGAMILTFYKGFEIKMGSHHIDLQTIGQKSGVHVAEAHHGTSILGLVLALIFCFSVSFSLIFQAKMSVAYPCHYSSTALISIMGTVQAAIYGLCVQRDWEQWKLGWNLKLLTVAYMGILASGIMWVFTMASVKMKGPLFVSVFNPLLLVLVAVAGAFLLNEKLHLGSVIGGVVIICGLYMVLWGKSKEVKGVVAVDAYTSHSFRAEINPSHNAAIAPHDPNALELISDEEQDLEANNNK